MLHRAINASRFTGRRAACVTYVRICDSQNWLQILKSRKVESKIEPMIKFNIETKVESKAPFQAEPKAGPKAKSNIQNF